ncbi:fibronectin type III domain-containing protein [Simiduia agarivorans]|uniref:Fibronectin type III domain-containing protein n=2 Tax=Simiduia agarivorans (strain DSM 21679 / JCM 13881 / BCRC 17597 / SA1) TaxID=1117647 RepID=K4KQN2_SIMAS|nr:fibronectin type III domain-containing protein [Simiduia agarivorans]AFV00434.2 fibronectin type III domain-containing protein [Simiduia agarivorans SA1 = DSM 21679]
MLRHLLGGLALLSLQSTMAATVWQPLNPGAGGQVQDVVADPNQANVVYMASDMEGVYKSTNNGESWQITGNLVNNRVFAVAVTPGNSNKIFVGTLYGLHISTNGSNSYALVPETENKSIASIAFKPGNANHIIAAPGWRDDDDFIGKFGETAAGPGQVFVSQNGGSSWQTVTFDSNSSTDRNVYSVVFDQSNANTVYLGSNKGVYKSTNGGLNWQRIAGPDDAVRPWNKGIALSPNGQVLYATYAEAKPDLRYNTNFLVYATRTSNINWQQVTGGLEGNRRYWYPEVDPRSTGNSHKVLLGAVKDRFGLYEGTFNWDNNGNLTNFYWEKIWDSYDGSWDIGWDYATPPNARFAHYTPVTGGWARGVWSTTNQTMYYASHNSGNNSYSWQNKYSTPTSQTVNWYGTEWPTYKGKGTESTYTYDVAVHENYVIQGQADNGLMESWDGGVSWSNMQHRRGGGFNLSDVQAVDIADAWGVPTVVAQATSGYGGGAHNGRLWAKRLNTHSPADQWVELAGGPNAKAGLPKGVLRDVAVSPANPAKVFMFSSNYGMYMVEDIGRALDYHDRGETLPVTQIYEGLDNSNDARIARKIAPHPTNEKVVFFSSTGGVQGVWRGEQQNDGSWTFAQVLASSGWDAEVEAWAYNGTVYLMSFAKGGGPGLTDGNNWQILLSTDEGQNWQKIFTPADAMAVRPTSNLVWWNSVGNRFKFTGKGGSAGAGNKIVMSYYDHDYQLGYGVFLGTIQSNGQVNWQDITDDLHFSGMTSSRFIKDAGQMYLYSTTPGAGLWRRSISGMNMDPAPTSAPAKPNNLNGQLHAATNTISLTWSDTANNETGFRIERSTAGGTYKVVGQVGRNTTAYTDFGLAGNTQYTYRVYAFNSAGQSANSNTKTLTSGDSVEPPEPCEPVNLTGDGNFTNGLGAWTVYANTSAGASATGSVGVESGFGSGNSLKVDIGAAFSTNDVQIQRSFGKLEAGKAYVLNFNAKAASNRTMEVKIHQASSPWQNIKTADEIQLTPQDQSFTLFYEPAVDFGNLKLGFFLGDNTADVWLDEVSLQRYCDAVVQLPPPASVTATAASASQANVSWSAVTDAAGYQVQYRAVGGSWATAEANTTATSASVSGLSAGDYEFRVRALASVGQSSEYQLSNVVTLEEAAGPWGAPGWIAVSVTSDNSVNVQWASVQDAVTYDVQQQLSTETTWRKAVYDVSGTATSVTGLTAGATYKFRVKARNASGQATSWTTSGSVNLSGSQPLAAPANADALAVSHNRVDVSWDAVTDADSYTLQRSVDGGAWAGLTSGVTGTSYSDTSVNPDTLYDYRIAAVNSSEQSGWTESGAVATPSAPSGSFGAPTGVSASKSGSTSVTVSWNPVVDAVTYDIQKFKAGDAWRKAEYDVTGTSVTITGLDAGATYTFRVKARNASGSASGWTESNAVNL